ncbi:MAG: hypothetical protein LC115_05925 [Bacteroidia bacterium]|nr:hypothetical protein [Bacteroidia bacterium]
MVRAIIIVAVLGVLFSCNKKTELPNNQLNIPVKDTTATGNVGNLELTVFHPVFGTGPGFFIKTYRSRLDLERNNYFKTTNTNKEGIATISSLPMGMVYFSCYYPQDPALTALDSIYILPNYTNKDSLFLQ